MSDLTNVISGLKRKSAARENPGDFRRDGLLYCGKCGMSKECRVDFGDGQMVVGSICLCEKKAIEREKEKQAQRERMLNALNLRVQGIQDRAMHRYTFAAAEESRNISRCRAYAERWPEMLANNAGLLFWGGVGVGKTYAAACIANAVIDRGAPVLMTSFPKILNSGWDKAEIADQMKRFQLLVIDDLGVERESDYALEIVQLVVDERYKSGMPAIVTTNLTLKELENPKNLRYARIYDRVLEMCVPVYFDGPSRRQEKRKDKLRLVREVFG